MHIHIQGYPDEYVLEDLEMTIADYVQRTMKANFGAAWEELVRVTLYSLKCIFLCKRLREYRLLTPSACGGFYHATFWHFREVCFILCDLSWTDTNFSLFLFAQLCYR